MAGLEGIVGDRERVLIQQTKEWGEILLGFESKNRFELRAEDGAVLGYAAEEASGIGQWFLRNLFGRCRKASIHIYDRGGNELGRGEKPFRWFFHRMEVHEAGKKLGAIQRKWSWFHREFVLENAAGQEVMQLRSRWFRIWTFTLFFQDQEVGAIRKKWGGLLKEMFTDADLFGVEVAPHVPVEVKKLLLVATFLVDFTCFENNTGGGSVVDFGGGD
ncbi:MAG: scramblase [Planctomycetes bacterium]|nr:scramblase [Planctomycetota bacterium]